jgi:hypothetical protein
VKFFSFLLLVFLNANAIAAPASVQKFVGKYCAECHDADLKKGGLNLEDLKFETEGTNAAMWIKALDRVMLGEMPPAKKARPAANDLKSFTNTVASAILESDRTIVAKEGRAVKRRLNRYEYEETLRDLLSLPFPIWKSKHFCPKIASRISSTK